VVQFDNFHVLVPFLPPGGTTKIKIPQDSIGIDDPPAYIFLSSAYSDQVEVNLFPPYLGASNPDVDMRNNSGSSTPGEIRPVLSTNNAFRCLGEISALASAALLTPATPLAAGVAITFQAAYGLGTSVLKFVYDMRDVSRDPNLTALEAFKILGKLLWGLAKTVWGVISSTFEGGLKIIVYIGKAIRVGDVVYKEWDGIGCAAVYPEARLLLQSMTEGIWEEANNLGDNVFGFFGGSPVDFLVIDSNGRQLVLRSDGTVDSSIPDAAAVRIAGIDLNLITLPASDAYTFQVRGLEVGSAEVGIVQGKNDGSVVTVAYGEVAQQPGSSASVDMNSSTTDYLLQIDADGNNTIDESLAPDSIDILSPPIVPPLGFSTVSLPQAEVGMPYSFKLDATGGKPPYRFILVSGSLPDGLGLVETGEIVGTPTTGAEATFTVKVEDLVGTFVTAELRLTVIAHTLTITSGPSGVPNPVDSGGAVNPSVNATDSLSHSLSYFWTASCPDLGTDGNFNNPDLQNPTWIAPANTTGNQQNCTIEVTVNDGQGLSQEGSYSQGVSPEEDACLKILSLIAKPKVANVGKTITVKMRVRNNCSEAITGVTPSALTVTGNGNVQLLPGWPKPPSATIEAGRFNRIKTFTWKYKATEAGKVRFTGFVASPGPLPPVTSNEMTIR
jgi:hypothetical protein